MKLRATAASFVASVGVVPAMAIVYFAGLLLLSGGQVALEPDSQGYLSFAPTRTLGYPVFLKLCGTPQRAIVVQMLLASAALAFLGSVVRRFTGSTLAAAAVMAGVMIHPDLAYYHHAILSESLFVSLTAVILGLLIRLIHAPTPLDAAALGTAIGLAIVVRLPGYAFIPLLPIAALLTWHRMRSRLATFAALAVAPIVILVAGERIAAPLVREPPEISLSALTFYIKSGMIDAGASSYAQGHPYRPVWEYSEHTLAPMRRLAEGAPTFDGRQYIATGYEVFAQSQLIPAAMVKEAARSAGTTPSVVMTEVGLRRLASAPLSYVRMAAGHFLALWRVFGPNHPSMAPQINAYLDRRRPLPFDDAGGALAKPLGSGRAAVLLQPALLALGVLSALGIAMLAVALAKRRLTRLQAVAGIAALMVNGNFLLVAMTNIGIPRYTWAMWPGLIVTSVFVALALLEACGLTQRFGLRTSREMQA